MRLTALALASALACTPAWADKPDCGTPGQLCATAVSRADRKAAEKAYERGRKEQRQGHTLPSLQNFSRALELNPYQPEYAQAEETARQQAVFEAIERGNALQAENRPLEALAAFRAALELDPKSELAQSRVQDVLPASVFPPVDPLEESRKPSLRLVAESDEVQLQPEPGTKEVTFRGDSRAMVERVAGLFGVTAVFDESFTSRPVRMQMGPADFPAAFAMALQMSKSFAVPLSEKQVLVAADTRANRLQLERMSLRTFVVEDATTAAELNDIVNLLRTIFDIRFVTPNPTRALIHVRGPKTMLDAATYILGGLHGGKTQVVLELKIYEVNSSLLRELGLDLPLQFRVFNVATEARGLVATPGIQDLINQLFASGGLNQIDPTAIAALLAALAGGSSGSSLLSQPIATFGGGKTLTGVVVPPVGLRLGHNQTWFRSLSRVYLRAAQGDTATFRSGSRYPILNASFSPIFNNPQITQAVQSQTFQAPFPSFSYEDLGLTFKAKPNVSARGEVTLDLEVQIKALSGLSFNSVPIISNREYRSSITVMNGDTAVFAGVIFDSEQNSLRGLPGFGSVPILRRMTGTTIKNDAKSQLLVLITPRVVRQGGGQADDGYLLPNN